MFLIYITDWHEAVSRDSLLYADGNCIVFQRKRVIEIEKQLIRNFSSLFGKFVDNKLSKHFGKNKTKTILFVTTHKLWVYNGVYNGVKIKQHAKAKYQGYFRWKSLWRINDFEYNWSTEFMPEVSV